VLPYFEHEHLVTFADTNIVGNVYFVNYLSWQGECRERFLARYAPGVVKRLTTDLALVTISCSCEYFCELFLFDVVSIRMSLAGMDSNRVTMAFSYYRTNRGAAQLLARGQQVVGCMERLSGALTPIPVPGELADALAKYSESARA